VHSFDLAGGRIAVIAWGVWNGTLARNGSSRCGWLGGYSAFAETLRAFGRIDFAARLRWLFDLLKPCAIAGGANSFGQTLTWFLHLRDDSPLPQHSNVTRSLT